jgi:hypothetical protein
LLRPSTTRSAGIHTRSGGRPGPGAAERRGPPLGDAAGGAKEPSWRARKTPRPPTRMKRLEVETVLQRNLQGVTDISDATSHGGPDESVRPEAVSRGNTDEPEP